MQLLFRIMAAETPAPIKSVSSRSWRPQGARVLNLIRTTAQNTPCPQQSYDPTWRWELRTLSFQGFIIILQPTAADKKCFKPPARRSWILGTSRIVSISGAAELFVLPLFLVFYLASAVGFYFRPTGGRCTSLDQNKQVHIAKLEETLSTHIQAQS
jgi:hypothetical protein